MSLIIAFLLPMVVLSIISVVFGASWTGTEGSWWRIIWWGIDQFLGYFEDKILPKMPKLPTEAESTFNIDPLTGAIVIITIIGAISIVIGIQILGSGLADWSIRTAMLTTVYISLWAVLTALSMSLIIEIEMFGGLIYIALTIGYTIGVIQKLSEN